MNIEPAITEQAPREAVIPNPKARLREQFREVMRYKHYALRTEEAYWQWIRRYILFHGKRRGSGVGSGCFPQGDGRRARICTTESLRPSLRAFFRVRAEARSNSMKSRLVPAAAVSLHRAAALCLLTGLFSSDLLAAYPDRLVWIFGWGLGSDSDVTEVAKTIETGARHGINGAVVSFGLDSLCKRDAEKGNGVRSVLFTDGRNASHLPSWPFLHPLASVRPSGPVRGVNCLAPIRPARHIVASIQRQDSQRLFPALAPSGKIAFVNCTDLTLLAFRKSLDFRIGMDRQRRARRKRTARVGR